MKILFMSRYICLISLITVLFNQSCAKEIDLNKAEIIPEKTTFNLYVALPTGRYYGYSIKYYIKIYKSNIDFNSDSNEIAKDSVVIKSPPLISNHKFVFSRPDQMEIWVKCFRTDRNGVILLKESITVPNVSEFYFYTTPQDWYCSNGTNCY